MSLRVGVVGAGRVTEEYWLPALADVGARTWLCDTNPARLKSLCRGLLVHACGTVDELVGRPLDLVIVATPARSHAAVAHAVADGCGPGRLLPVLLEKPPVVSAGELDGLLEREDQRRIRPYGSFLRRSLPAPRRARQRFGSWTDRFGPLAAIEIWEGRPYAWRSQGARSGTQGLESMLFDELSHAVDLALFMASAEVSGLERVAVMKESPLRFEGRCRVVVAGAALDMDVHGSRAEVLANVVTFRFGGGSVTVEQGFGGAIVVRPAGARPECLDPGPPPAVGAIFASLARTAAAGGGEAASSVAPLADWRSALDILEAFSLAPVVAAP